ncbi:MAG: luciferase family protein [Terrimesophilobacter sp.]
MSDLPTRLGDRPRTSATGPHCQLNHQSPPSVWGKTVAAVFALPHVVEGHSAVSPASSRALFLDDVLAPRIPQTSLAPPSDRLEPVHLHGVSDTSLHLCLPRERALEVCSRGWGEPHHYADHETEIMVYGPRDRDELSTVLELVRESIAYARG